MRMTIAAVSHAGTRVSSSSQSVRSCCSAFGSMSVWLLCLFTDAVPASDWLALDVSHSVVCAASDGFEEVSVF